MAFIWSDKQKAAIEALNTNVLVSASAGAGKTTVLIGRLMKRIEIDRISLDQVVAMTFTELAAMEMRKRLLKELNKRYTETKDEYLKEQISLLPSAQISTIHSFCLNLVQSYAYVLNLDPAFANDIIDETRKTELMEEAFESVYISWAKQKPAQLKELAMHFDSRPESVETLKDQVYRLTSKLNTLQNPDRWIEKSINVLDASSIDALPNELKHYLALHYLWKIKNLQVMAKDYEYKLASADYLSTLDEKKQAKLEKVQIALDAYHVALKTLEFPLDAFNYDAFRRGFMALSQYPIGAFPDKSKDEHEKIAKVLKRLEAVRDDMLTNLFEEAEWIQDHALIKPRMISLGAFAKDFQKAYQELKQKAKAMDFDDMEHYALSILRDQRFKVGEQLKARYQEILVDEFQDTNEVQNEIVELISNGHNIFRVGDVKQSIYRFRNAQPKLMQDLMHTQDANHTLLFLDENYRSDASIVDFNNLLFDKLMNFRELGSSYAKDDFVKTGRKEQAGGLKVEFHLIDTEIEEEEVIEEVLGEESPENGSGEDEEILITETVDPFKETDESAEPKAVHIINTIDALRKQHGYAYKDFVILVRSNLLKTQLKKQFEAAQIPHHISTKTGFFNSDGVQDVLLLLNHLFNARDNANFIGLCLSDFIGLNEEQLVRLKLKRQNREPYSDVFAREYPQLAQKLEDFVTKAKGKSILDVIRSVYAYNDYYDRSCTKQQRANLDLLFEKTVRFAQEGVSLSQLLTRIKNIKDEESSEAIPFTEEDDVVRVMTIHQSKGLEFKVVFYWSGGKSTIQDNKAPVLSDTQLGFMLNTILLPENFTRRNPIRLALEMKSVMDDVQEQIRLLYVALTRAEKQLILVDKKPTMHYPLHYTNILNSLGPTNWILSALRDNDIMDIQEYPTTQTFTVQPVPEGKAKELVILPKLGQSIEFKTPSSTHKNFTHFKLNFNKNIGSNHGNLMHELFEKLPLSGWTEDLVSSIQPDINLEDLDSVMTFYQDPIYQAMLKGEIKREFPFHSLQGNVVYHGFMDLISITEDTCYLVDYKTDLVESPDVLIELYQEQLQGYASVLRQMYPNRKVETYLYSIVHKVFIEIT